MQNIDTRMKQHICPKIYSIEKKVVFQYSIDTLSLIFLILRVTIGQQHQLSESDIISRNSQWNDLIINDSASYGNTITYLT